MCVVQQGMGGRGDNHDYCWHLTDPTVRVGSHVMYDPAYRLHHLCTGASQLPGICAGLVREPPTYLLYILRAHAVPVWANGWGVETKVRGRRLIGDDHCFLSRSRRGNHQIARRGAFL